MSMDTAAVLLLARTIWSTARSTSFSTLPADPRKAHAPNHKLRSNRHHVFQHRRHQVLRVSRQRFIFLTIQIDLIKEPRFGPARNERKDCGFTIQSKHCKHEGEIRVVMHLEWLSNRSDPDSCAHVPCIDSLLVLIIALNTALYLYCACIFMIS